jgi:hypothetical protein
MPALNPSQYPLVTPGSHLGKHLGILGYTSTRLSQTNIKSSGAFGMFRFLEVDARC